MHILIIPSTRYLPKDDPVSGIFHHYQAQALLKDGYKIGVISPEFRSLLSLRTKLFGWPSGIEFDEVSGIPVVRNHGWRWFPKIRYGRIWLWRKSGKLLFEKYISRYGMPDIIHAHNSFYAGIIAYDVKERYNIPYVITEHKSSFPRGLIKKSEISYIRKAYFNSKCNSVVSPYLGNAIEKTTGIPADSFEWIPNNLGEIFEDNAPEQEQEKKAKEIFTFLNVGPLIKIKGHYDLILAFAEKFGNRKDVRLKIIGDGPLRKNVERLIEKLSLSDQVFLLGRLGPEKVKQEMRNCGVYVHSSHFETFSVVVIEALSCGRPVVSTRCGGPEYLVNESNGVLVPLDNISALGNAMLNMMQSIDKFDSKKIREECIRKYGIKAITEKLSKIYNSVLSNT